MSPKSQTPSSDLGSHLRFILSEVEKYYPDFGDLEKKTITKAFNFGHKSHGDQRRFSGEIYFLHPIEATKILLSIKPDIDTICACLLHDVIEDTPVTGEEIGKIFGPKVKFLCEGVEKISKIRLQGKEREFESLRKLFMAMAKDIRVIFIKLSDRIHNLRTLEHVRPDKQVRIAKESLKIYASVAEKIGLSEFEHQIKDLSFRYIEPEIYADIVRQIEVLGKQKKDFFELGTSIIRNLLTEEEIPFLSIEGRIKNIYSIYEKMKKKNFTQVGEIYDLFAIRIITPKKVDCYRVLGVLHVSWKPISNRFKDYIAVPKPNGYQSLHTTILGFAKSKFPTEIQIRTPKMHLDAEFGPAAHWAYKELKHSGFKKKYLKTTYHIPENLEESMGMANPEEFFQKMLDSLSQERIHVFTPAGEPQDLPKGATPIDFAFAVHTEVGLECIGARVNGVIKPLNSELKTGDIVEIRTQKGRKPNPLWLNFIKSPHARNKIRNYLNQNSEDSSFFETKKVENLKKEIKTEMKKTTERPEKNTPEIIIGEASGMSYRLAVCCHPSPNNPIVAYNSRGFDFVIHEESCSEIKSLDPDRFLEAHYKFTRYLLIEAQDRIGLLRDVSAVLSQNGVNILSFDLHTKKDHTAQLELTIEVSSYREMEEIKKEILKIPNVIGAEILETKQKIKKTNKKTKNIF